MNRNFAENQFINERCAKYNSERKTAAYPSAKGISEYVGDALYENARRRARERANAPAIVTKKVKAKPFPISFVFYALILSCVFMFICYNYSVINDISYDTQALESQINLLKEENNRLKISLDTRNDLEYIEEVAVTKLGMVKSTDVAKHYVSLAHEDSVVVTRENSESTHLGTTLNSLKKNLRKIYE